jgi:hypothetical protein
LGADPNHASPESLAHRAQCATCDKYAQEMLRLNGVIKRALEIPVRASKSRNAPRMRWYAMAASLLLFVGFGGVFWFLSYIPPSLAGDVVAHLAHEPETLTASDARISAELLDAALKSKGMHLALPMSDVSYVQSCSFRGDFVPHLVVQTERGAATVLLLPKETVPSAQRFEEQSYRGLLIPMAHGSMAVVATDAALADLVAEKVKASIAWDW